MYLMSNILSSQEYPCLPHLIEIDLEAARTGSTWHHRCPTPTPAAGDGGLVGVARLFRAQVDGDLVLAQARQIQGNAQPVREVPPQKEAWPMKVTGIAGWHWHCAESERNRCYE